ncbi:hypothetical protein KUW17_18000 [Leisingera aquaemixtae]|uniref:hypothetical protein n=1 Tax=Leisingera aquaemixtae TaxID=1396826 RepID=UPI001C954A77|nr:hypothetical protein [Leisingera aquaemixtae]MBY6068643.1 hypothetical protein [Leisingera aquaemixtae]
MIDTRDVKSVQNLDRDLKMLRSPARLVESAGLGRRFVLFAPASGAIVLTDRLGIELLSGVVACEDAKTIASRLSNMSAASEPFGSQEASEIASAILASWRDAGLFAKEQLPFPDAVTDHGGEALNKRGYVSEFGRLLIESDDLRLAEQLDEILGQYACEDIGAGQEWAKAGREWVKARCVYCEGGGRGVFLGDTPLWGRSTRDEARYFLIREAAETLCGDGQVGAVLHGAAVLGSSGALLIVGDSGRGKSTLAQGLVEAGCGFLADDHLPLHLDGRHLLAFPAGSAVKHGARELSEVRRLAVRHGKLASSRNRVNYLTLPPAAAVGARVPIKAIVLPEFRAGSDLAVEKIDPEQAFTDCVVTGARPSRRNTQITPLAVMCDTFPAYRLIFGESQQSVSACLDLLSSCNS